MQNSKLKEKVTKMPPLAGFKPEHGCMKCKHSTSKPLSVSEVEWQLNNMNVNVKFGVVHEGPRFEIFKYYLK